MMAHINRECGHVPSNAETFHWSRAGFGACVGFYAGRDGHMFSDRPRQHKNPSPSGAGPSGAGSLQSGDPIE